MVVRAGTDRCPECGMELPGDTWSKGLCPRCLFELAVDESPTEAPTVDMPSESLSLGAVLGGRYQIAALLGRGGMGEVWRAQDLKLRVEVALKALRPQLIGEERALELLRDEVRSAREVISPNVCRVFDLVELDGNELVSMEFIDGITLLDVMKMRAPLELTEAREIASQFLAGLEAIHRAGLVHRDLKPENIMITRSGRVVVMDFGIAKVLEEGHAATVSGTPAYMAAEQARGEALSALSDVFSAGVVLAEMIAPEGLGSHDMRAAIWEGVHSEPPAVADSPWSPVIRKAVARIPDQRFASASALARALEEVTLRVEGAEDIRPYPGLASFKQEDAEYFFGRELEVEEMWKKLQRPHLLGLIGPSGAGKSSFIRAGLLAVIPTGWRAVIATPSNRPFTVLSQALVEEFAGDAEAIRELLRFEEMDVAVSLVSRWRQQHEQVLIVIDQFEELFTQSPRDVQQQFAELLGRMALEADVHVLLAMRDDFLFHCHAFEALRPLLSELTLLGPPTGAALRRAIVQPALKCGYRFEDEALVEEMVGELTDERGALPMLAFAAARLWDHRDREQGLLTREAYEHIGGVGGALAQHAEATLERIGQDRIPIVRELFRNLITAEGTRAARDREELLSVFSGRVGDVGEGLAPSRGDETTEVVAPRAPARGTPTSSREDAEGVLAALIDARLVTSYELPASDDGDSGQQRVEIIHESLLTSWPRLVRWQTQDVEGAQLREELRQTAQMWEQHNRSEDLLWTGTAFREFELWRDRYPGGLTETEEAFAEAMVRHAERRRRRRRIAVVAALLMALLVAVVTGGLWLRAEEGARRAEAANLFSIAQARLEEHPSGALAYATASLERADSTATRRLVLKALWKGPTEIRLPEGSWISLDFSPDGKWLATSFFAEGCRIWPSDGGEPIRLDGCEEPMEGLFDPTGQSIAYALNAGGDRQQIAVWSFPEGRLLRTLKLGGLATYFFRFDPSGQLIVTSTDHLVEEQYEVEIRSWPLEGATPGQIARVEMPRESIGAFVGVDPTLSRLVWSEGARLRLAAIENGSPDMTRVGTIEQDQLISMTAFDPGNRRVATLDASGVPRVWSVEDDPPRLDRRLPPANRGMIPSGVALRFDPAGSMLAHAAGYLWRLDAPPGAELQRLRRTVGAVEGEDSESGFGLAFHPNGRWVATGHTQSVSLWPLARRYPYVLQGHEGWLKNVRFAPDGEWLVSTAGDNSVRVWPFSTSDRKEPVVIHQLEGAYPPRRIKVAPNGSFVVLGTYTDGILILSVDGKEIRTLTGFTDAVVTVAVGPQSRLVAAGAGFAKPDEAFVRIWDLESGETRILDDGTRKRLHRVEFEDENTLLVASFEGTLKRWILDEEPPRISEEFDIPGPAVDIRPEIGQILALDSDPGSLWLYDLKRRSSRELSSHGSSIASASIDPTGEVVASVDKDGVVRVGPASGEEPHLLLGHEGEINHVTFSPDGRWIATGGDDQLIYIWPRPDMDEPPLHTWPREKLLAKLKTLTNLRAVGDPDSPSGWKLEIGPFPGWEEVPKW